MPDRMGCGMLTGELTRTSLAWRTRGAAFRHHAAAGRTGRDRAGRLAGAGPAAARRRLDGALRAGRRAGLPGGRPPRRRRALVRPVRPRPDVAAPGGASGDDAAPAWHLPFQPGGPVAAVGVTMPPWPGDHEAYEVPGAWPADSA